MDQAEEFDLVEPVFNRQSGILDHADVQAVLDEVGMIIRGERLALGLTQAELAEQWGVSCSVLCRLELGNRDMSLRYLLELSGLLLIPASEILKAAQERALPFMPADWSTGLVTHVAVRRRSSTSEVREAARMTIFRRRFQAALTLHLPLNPNDLRCRECRDAKGKPVAWPCPTRRALTPDIATE